MVNFDNETTVSIPPGEVVKIVILERREQLIEALESYHNYEGGNLDTQQKESIIRARVMALWYQLQAIAKRRLKQEGEYDIVKETITASRSWDELVECFEWMNEFIDTLGLTYIDNRERYDRTNVEESNTRLGL